MKTLQVDFTNTQCRDEVKPLKLGKRKDDATMETCSTKENLIYYALRIKHPLRGWQSNKHNNKCNTTTTNNNNIVIKLTKCQREHTHSSRDQSMHITILSRGSL